MISHLAVKCTFSNSTNGSGLMELATLVGRKLHLMSSLEEVNPGAQSWYKCPPVGVTFASYVQTTGQDDRAAITKKTTTTHKYVPRTLWGRSWTLPSAVVQQAAGGVVGGKG